MKPAQGQILDDVSEIIQRLMEEAEIEAEEITNTSKFSGDLCFSSIDFIEMAATIDVQFARRFPYESLLLKDGKYREDLTVGELVGFISDNFDSAQPITNAL